MGRPRRVWLVYHVQNFCVPNLICLCAIFKIHINYILTYSKCVCLGLRNINGPSLIDNLDCSYVEAADMLVSS